MSTIGVAAQADSVAPPFSYSKPSPDGRYLFVMIAPDTSESDMSRWTEERVAKVRAIRETYAKSGLYRNDGTTIPLWTVHWYAYNVDLASDGVHIVRHGRWASHTEEEAFSFFANGQLVRSYTISELIDLKFLLTHTVSHFFWSESQRFDDATLRYHVSTKDGNSFVFDIASGGIVQETRRARLKLWAALLAVALLAGGWTTFAVRRRRLRRTRSRTAV